MHDIRCESWMLIPTAIIGLLVTAVLLPVIIIVSLVEAWR
jgi:branched-subunit amino acid permease